MEMRGPTVILLTACFFGPAVLVFVFPPLHAVAPILMIAGLAALILSFLLFSFRRSPAGPFRQWTEPAKFFSTVFTRSELLTLRISACVAVGGALAVGVLMATGN